MGVSYVSQSQNRYSSDVQSAPDSLSGLCKCSCDTDCDGETDACFPCPNSTCYTCDKNGDGCPDSCYTCDGNGDGTPDSCYKCDTNGDGKPDSCYTCDLNGDGIKDACYQADTDKDGINDSCKGGCAVTPENPRGDYTCDTDGDGKKDSCFTCDTDGDGKPDSCFTCDTDDDGRNDSCLCVESGKVTTVCGDCAKKAKRLNENVPALELSKTLSESSAKDVLKKIGHVPPAVAKMFPVTVDLNLGEFEGSGEVEWDCCNEYCKEPVKGYTVDASIGASASVKAKVTYPGFAGNYSTSIGQYSITVDWLLGAEVSAKATGQASVSREDKCDEVCEEIDATASLSFSVFVGGKGTAKLVSNAVTTPSDGSPSGEERVGIESSATVGAEASTTVKASCSGKYGSCETEANCQACWEGATLEVPLRFKINLPMTEQIQFTWEFEKILCPAELPGGCE